jgi:hypothetical protein
MFKSPVFFLLTLFSSCFLPEGSLLDEDGKPRAMAQNTQLEVGANGEVVEDSGSVSDRIREMQENYEKQQKERVAAKQEPCDCNGIDIKEECPTSVSGFDWEGYADELYKARALIFSAEIDQAKISVLNLLHLITQKFSFAFECPLAVVSTYWTLANILVMEKNLRRALVMLQMGFIFVRDRGFHECTPWPVQVGNGNRIGCQMISIVTMYT